MQFKLLTLLIFSPLISFSQLDSLKGNVKSVKESIQYTEKFGLTLYHRDLDFGQYSLTDETILKEFKKGLFSRFQSSPIQKEFDKKGRLIKLIFFTNKDSSSSSNYKYIYDEYDNLVQEKSELSNGEYEVTNYRYRSSRDSIDRIMAEINYGSDPDRFSMKQYFYDNTDQLIEVRELSGFGWDKKINYKYDDRGRLVSEINSNLKRVLKYDSVMMMQTFKDINTDYYEETFNYYADGSIKEKISGCSPDFTAGACQKIVYKYDSKKRKSAVYYYWMAKDSLFSRRHYYYNTDNSLKKIEWFFKNEPQPKNFVEYFYKDKELVKAVFSNIDKITIFEFQYKTDQKNNWTEQIKLVDGQPFYIRKREITYWD